jgi:hypothetical protein
MNPIGSRISFHPAGSDGQETLSGGLSSRYSGRSLNGERKLPNTYLVMPYGIFLFPVLKDSVKFTHSRFTNADCR